MPFVSQEQERCTACNRIVYQTEKTIVEEKDQKKVYHKTCIRCAYDRCNKVLSLGQYSSIEGKFYCKPHFKQLFATKGNYEEGFGIEKDKKWEAAPAPAKPVSFVPVESTETKIAAQKVGTSEATAEKFRKWREEGASEVCASCARAVFLAEKLIVEEKNSKKIFHKNCFKCAQCEVKLDLRNYGSNSGKVYCLTHLKEINAADRRPGSVITSASSFIPEVKDERVTQKAETPSHIAEKFKGLGASGDKCKSCGKTVYAKEKVIVEELKNQNVYHKTCLRCSKCNIQLDLSNMGSSGGIIFCMPHLKQFGKPELQKDGGYFVSPLHSATDYQPQYEQPQEQSGEPEQSREERYSNDQDAPQHRQSPATQSPRESPAQSPYQSPSNSRRSSLMVEEERRGTQEERIKQEERPRSGSIGEDGSDEERRRKREERDRQREEEERKFQEEREKREREREERRRNRDSQTLTSTSSTTSSSSDDGSDLEKRRKEREDRRKQQEEEAKREEEEAQRRAEERRKRLAALRDN